MKVVVDSLMVNMKSKVEDIGGCILNFKFIDGDLKDIRIEMVGIKLVL